MKGKKKKARNDKTTLERIKVQLDSRTVIILHSMAALKNWLVRYPEAKVIS